MNKAWIFPLFFFVAIASYTYQFAAGSTIFSPIIGDDKSFLVGSYHLSQFENLSQEQKWEYAYFHIHKPLIIDLMVLFHWLDIAKLWFLIPFAFYLLGGIFLYLFLKDRVHSALLLYGSVLILLFNSIWMYFGMHLLPDIPLGASLMAMLFFLDRAVKPDGKFSKRDWHLAMLSGIVAALFRIEVLPALLVPPLYYAYVKYHGEKGVLNWLKVASADRNVVGYAIGCVVIVSAVFLAHMLLIEKTLDIWNYPAILAEQLSKVREATDAIGANKGNGLYTLSETVLSFTILPFIVSMVGLYLILKRKETAYYPAAALFTFLFLESTLITVLAHGEQRYVTRLFPMLAIFLAYALDYAKRKYLDKHTVGAYVTFAVVALLLYSSYYLVHSGLGRDNKIEGYTSRMVTINASADRGFEGDRIASSADGYYYISETLKDYKKPYGNIFTNAMTDDYEEIFWIIERKRIYGTDSLSVDDMAPKDIAVLISTIGESNVPSVVHRHFEPALFFPNGVDIYVVERDALVAAVRPVG